MLKVMIPNLKLVMKKEYENMGTFLLKVTLKIVQNKFLLLKISKIQYHGDMLSMILTIKKTYQKEFRVDKW